MSEQTSLDRKKIAKLSEKIINDPVLLRKLSNRLYELMKEDVQNQSERNGQSRRFYS